MDWSISNCQIGKESERKKVEMYLLPIQPLSEAERKVVENACNEFKEYSKKKDIKTNSETKDTIKRILLTLCLRNNIKIDEKQERYLSEYIYMDLAGFSGLDLILNDENIEEIAMIGVNKPIYVYKTKEGWFETNLKFNTSERAIDTINKMARSLGRRVTFQNPKINAVLPDGSRLHASIPPISDIEMTIRKFRSNPISTCDLFINDTFSLDAIAFLSLVFQSDYNVLISGNTASGKTSTLNALFSFVPLNDRVVIIEETPEINIPHKHKVKLVANDDLKIDMKSLVEDSLRMRPDRVIVGEVRTEGEISALMESILSGQARGSYATFHARSADEVVKRLALLGVLKVDISSIDFIVIQRRMMRYNTETRRYWEERRGIEIVELYGNAPDINRIFYYDSKSQKLIKNIENSKKIEEIADSFSLSKSEVFDEINFRKDILKKIAERKLTFNDTITEIQKRIFSTSGNKEINKEGMKDAKGKVEEIKEFDYEIYDEKVKSCSEKMKSKRLEKHFSPQI